ncbi:MAG: helix-turn-helix domain-containing protein [Frankia sp.]|nr:helix-turn-helix domain-containing protein [Frankia sp.]
MDGESTDQERLWTVQDLAGFLGVPVNTVYKWRTTGDGPPGLRIGRHVRYRREDVEAWLATRVTVRD